jgi:hypothetical protein
MYFLILSFLSLILAILPWRLSLLGRVMGLLSASWCWVYGAAVAGGRAPLGVGALGNFVSLDPSPFGGEGVTATLGFLFAVLAAITYRRDAGILSTAPTSFQLPRWLSYTVLLVSLLSALYILGTLGAENIVAYSTYGSIKELNVLFAGNPIGRLIATTFRFTSMLLIVVSIYNYSNGSKTYTMLAVPVILIAFAIGLAEASRIVSVYFGVVGIGFLLVGRRFLALLSGGLALLAVAYALEARSNPSLGLAYVPQYLLAALQGETLVESVLVNVSAGLLVTSASIKVAIPDAYGVAFKILSFMPTIDAIDGFQLTKAVSEQRVLSYIPFNAFAEAWLFGPLSMIALWTVIACSIFAVNSSMKLGVFPFLLLLSIFCLGWVVLSQYPIRNGLRYFYLLLLVRAALPNLRHWWKRRHRKLSLSYVPPMGSPVRKTAKERVR